MAGRQPLGSPPSDGYLSSTRTDRSAMKGAGSASVHCACSCPGDGQSSRTRCSTCVQSSRRSDVAMAPAMPRRCRSHPAIRVGHSSFTTTGCSGKVMKTGRSTRERRTSSTVVATGLVGSWSWSWSWSWSRSRSRSGSRSIALPAHPRPLRPARRRANVVRTISPRRPLGTRSPSYFVDGCHP
jgi:hypothetical protein